MIDAARGAGAMVQLVARSLGGKSSRGAAERRMGDLRVRDGPI